MTAAVVDVEPFERQRGESGQAFGAFAAYRDLGPTRTVRRVAQELSKSVTLISRWSSKWRWVERVIAWDNRVDAEAREAVLAEVRAMHTRHAAAGRLALEKVMEALEQMEPATMTPRDIARVGDVFVRMERFARGEAETRVQVAPPSSEGEYELSERLMADPALVAKAEELAAAMLESEPVDRRRGLHAVAS
jgi:hypothetical protein